MKSCDMFKVIDYFDTFIKNYNNNYGSEYKSLNDLFSFVFFKNKTFPFDKFFKVLNRTKSVQSTQEDKDLCRISSNFIERFIDKECKLMKCNSCKMVHGQMGSHYPCSLKTIYYTLNYTQNWFKYIEQSKSYSPFVEKRLLIEFFENFQKMIEIGENK